MDVALGDVASGGMGSAKGTAGLNDRKSPSQLKPFHNSFRFLFVLIPRLFPGAGEISVFFSSQSSGGCRPSLPQG